MNMKPGKGIAVSKSTLDEVTKKLSGYDPAVKAFTESLEVGQIITGDLLVVIGAVEGLLKSGLTRRAICLLVRDQLPKGPRGSTKYELAEVDAMLDALANLHQCIEKPKDTTP